MTIYLEAATSASKVAVDHIEVALKNGRSGELTWDESDIAYNPNGFTARFNGVYLDENYANGKFEQLDGMKVTDVALCSQAPNYPAYADIAIIGMSVEDGERCFEVDGCPIYSNNHCYISWQPM